MYKSAFIGFSGRRDIVAVMTKTISEAKPQMPAPRAGMVIEPVTTYEELPIVTEAARAELLASLERGEDDLKAGRVKRMSVAELKADMRADFQKTTGYKIS
jgi:hypothetical protein